MFVGFSVAFFPIVILAGAKLQPRQQLLDDGAATFVPVLEIIDDGVACVMGTHCFFRGKTNDRLKNKRPRAIPGLAAGIAAC